MQRNRKVCHIHIFFLKSKQQKMCPVVLDLVNRTYKLAIINMFKDLKETRIKKLKVSITTMSH